MGVAARRTPTVGALLSLGVLLLAAPAPTSALRDLRHASSAVEPTAPLVAAVALLSWLLTGWLALTVLLTLLSRIPGGTGRAASAAVRRVAPAAVRRLVAVSLGLTVAAGPVTASPAAAAADGAAAGSSAAAPGSLDWPGSTPPPDLDWPAPQAGSAAGLVGPDEQAAPVLGAPTSTGKAAEAVGAPTSTGKAAEAVVVRRGDTLWGLAARALEQQKQAAPSDREVAAAWPAWWSANRQVVGEDPDLLLPGTPLQPPRDDAGGDAAPGST